MNHANSEKKKLNNDNSGKETGETRQFCKGKLKNDNSEIQHLTNDKAGNETPEK